MGKEKVVYLIPSELIVFDAVFNGAKEVCIAGVCTPQSRVGISNGVEHALLDRLASIGEMDQTGFLREFVQRMIRAGIVHPEGARIDTEVVGVLQILVPRDRISVHEIARRDTKRLTATDFETMQKCFTLWHPGVRLEKFVREVLKVPEPEVHKWACSLVRWGVAENVSGSKSPAEAQWIAVEKNFPLFHFSAENQSAQKKSEPIPTPKPVEPKSAPAPKPEIKLAEEPKVRFSGAMVCAVLMSVCDKLTQVSVDEKEKAQVDLDLAEARIIEESKRVTEAMQKGEAIDTGEYNRLVVERKRLSEIMNHPDNSSLIVAYEMVIDDLIKGRIAPESEFGQVATKVHVSVIPSEPVPPGPSPEPSFFGTAVKSAIGRWQSNTGLSVVQLAIYSVMKAGKLDWLTSVEIYNLLSKFDESVARVLLAGALYDEARGMDGLFEKRIVAPEERAAVAKVARGIKYVYRLTAKGRAAAKKLLEKPLAEEVPVAKETLNASSRPASKKRKSRRKARKKGWRCLSERIAKSWASAPSPLPSETLILRDVHAIITSNGESEIPSAAMAWGMSRRPDLFEKETIVFEAGHKAHRGESKFKYRLTSKALKMFGAKKK